MPHIHTLPGQHDLTTTAFIVRVENGIPLGLLHVHRKLGLLLPVGGHVELHENPWSAATHEIAEESGYDMADLEVLQPVDRIRKMDGVKTHPTPLFLQTHEFKQGEPHFHIDVGFAFLARDVPQNPPTDGESTELLWMTNEQIQSRVAEMPIDVAQIYDFVLTNAVDAWERVRPESFDA